ncbi:acyl-CoA dehydrogenase family protein [Corynebacterium sp. HMSC076D02]|uniref:acyl-CoA dehydrogenase family protein n=1 Tax=Corynebacterium sp. HMSC076D02 TaxID=1739439 RepID=UPI0008A5DDA7|nr:acyl-CoA dehydrogenase family protein [Corynebacterium sp. HMSC076D02]OFQ42952.1 acyl-CoA oxidase [Corynebacterium sp. HMSC076D02]
MALLKTQSKDSSATSSTEANRANLRSTTAQAEPRSPRRLPKTPQPSVATELGNLLDGPHAAFRQELRKFINDPELFPHPDLSVAEQRAHTFNNLAKVLDFGGFQKGLRRDNGGPGKPILSTFTLEGLAWVDGSLAIKSGVQWGLWGGALDQLGTERHIEWVQKAASLELPGCFAMTERGHGSDVQSLETTANYDPETDEFIINTPSDTAVKNYIGNAAQDGRAAVVFTQLMTPESDGRTHGVHAIIVPIRDEQGNALPGITLGDHGHKGGLVGVDNGTLRFDNVRVPRVNLLNRFADVDEKGRYSSPIENPNARFFTMLGTLIRGRMGVAGAAGAATEASLDIAVRYANRRRQFEGATGAEKRLIDHRQHRRRLLIPLARSYALHLLHNQILERYQEMNDSQEAGSWSVTTPTEEQKYASREMESLAGAIKAAQTQHAIRTIQECREACGGAGYMSENRLTTYRADSDVFATFEGDNTVLIQMVGKNLLTAYGRAMNDMSPWDTVRYAATTATEVVRRRTGFTTRLQGLVDLVNPNEASLFDAVYQAKLIDDRAQSVLLSLVRRIQPARKADKVQAAAIVDQCQDHLIAAGWARVDTLLVQAMIEAEDRLEVGSLARQVFEQLRHLFVLSTLVEHAGWYQEHHLLPAGRMKAARAAINDLVDSLAPWSVVLVDAFGLPSEVSNIPMLTEAGVDPLRD